MPAKLCKKKNCLKFTLTSKNIVDENLQKNKIKMR